MAVLSEHQKAIAALDDCSDVRVLRRFRPRHCYDICEDPKIGLFVDVESTGLNTDEDSIIQFGAVRFEFDSEGRIGHVGPSYSALEDPGRPLTPEIVEITGLTDEQLRGQKIDEAKVAEIQEGVVLTIAHNADFDRKMVERRLAGFNSVYWACSQRDVKWERFGARSVGLEFLMMQTCNEFYEPHDALDDCLAGIHILATPRLKLEQLELDGRASVSPFQMLLDSVRQPTFRLWAWQSPIATKDRLRLRRFRWDGNARCWWKDLKASELQAEQDWLLEHVYDGDPDWAQAASTTKISALDRYSIRA